MTAVKQRTVADDQNSFEQRHKDSGVKTKAPLLVVVSLMEDTK